MSMPSLASVERATKLRAQARVLEGVVVGLYRAADELADKEEEGPFFVTVRIITAKGDLSMKTYTYLYDDTKLVKGTVVVVPGMPWSPPTTYAVVTKDSGEERATALNQRYYSKIVRVVTE